MQLPPNNIIQIGTQLHYTCVSIYNNLLLEIGALFQIGTHVASQFVITFQFVINYYKLERICNTIASQFVINYYKLERICTAAASQFVINYYKLARICNVFAFQFVIKYYILDDTQSTLENKKERSLPLSSRYRVNVGFDILIIHIIKLT